MNNTDTYNNTDVYSRFIGVNTAYVYWLLTPHVVVRTRLYIAGMCNTRVIVILVPYMLRRVASATIAIGSVPKIQSRAYSIEKRKKLGIWDQFVCSNFKEGWLRATRYSTYICEIVIFKYISTRYRPRFFDQDGHQTTSAYIENKHFFTKSCLRQTY